jgi:hypothetical protein
MRGQKTTVASTHHKLLPGSFDRYAKADEALHRSNTILHVKTPAVSKKRAHKVFAESD